MRFEKAAAGIFFLSLGAALVAFYRPFLLGKESFFLSDITYYYEPLTRFIADALRGNRLPLWNPYVYCGMPEIAVPAPGIFYPLTWLFVLLPFNQALALFLIVHQFLAGAGAYLFVLALGWGAAAAAVAGFVASFNGYMFSLQTNFPLMASASWMPLALWAVLSIGPKPDTGNLLRVAAAGAIYGLLISSGRPEITLPETLILVAFVALSAFALWRRDRVAGQALSFAFWRMLALLAGLLAAMASVVPVAEWVPLSPRAKGLSPAEVLRWSANWYDLLCLVVLQPLGDLQVHGNHFLPVVAARPGFIPYVASAFIGPVAATLALWGALDCRFRWRWLVLALLVGATVLALGDRTPIFPFLLSVCPTLALFRYPVKMIVVSVWCLALLAGRGASVALAARPPSYLAKGASGAWLAFGFAGGALAFSPEPGLILSGFKDVPLDQLDLLNGAAHRIGEGLMRAAAVGLGFSGIAYLRARGRVSEVAFALFLATAVAATLLAGAFTFSRHGAAPDFFARRPYVSSLIERASKAQAKPEQGGKAFPEPAGTTERYSRFRVLALYFDPLTCPDWYKGPVPYPGTADFYQYSRDLALPLVNIDAGLTSPWGYESADTREYRRLFYGVLKCAALARVVAPSLAGAGAARKSSDLPLARFCRMTATRYVLTQAYRNGRPAKPVPGLDARYFKLLSDDKAMNVRLYEVVDSMPRAYFALNWRFVESACQAVKSVIEDTDFHPERVTLIERQGRWGSPTWTPGEPGADAAAGSWIEFLKDEPEHVALSIKAQAPAVVVLADSFYPGWQAKLDGLPVDVHRANGVHRAVFVLPGSHLLEFDYRPESLDIAFAQARIGLAIIAGLVLWAAGQAFWRMAVAQSRWRPERQG